MECACLATKTIEVPIAEVAQSGFAVGNAATTVDLVLPGSVQLWLTLSVIAQSRTPGPLDPPLTSAALAWNPSSLATWTITPYLSGQGPSGGNGAPAFVQPLANFTAKLLPDSFEGITSAPFVRVSVAWNDAVNRPLSAGVGNVVLRATLQPAPGVRLTAEQISALFSQFQLPNKPVNFASIG